MDNSGNIMHNAVLLCKCGCGCIVKEGNTFITWHNRRGFPCSIGMSGKHQTQESKDKMCKAHIGKHHTEETKQMISQKHRGKHLSEEHKRKIGLASTGRKWNDSARAKFRASNIGRQVSPETRQKISRAVMDFMEKYPERQGNRVLARQGRISKPQLKMYDTVKMKTNGIEVLLNHYVRTLGHYRFIDVAIPSLMLGFEYDGEYFHSDTYKDKQRDSELVALGWTIAHIDNTGLKYIAGNQTLDSYIIRCI